MSQFNLVKLKRSPLSDLYRVWYSSGLDDSLAANKSSFTPNTISILNGLRTKRYPLIALTTRRSMGPARHILSQRVVAGTMVVNAPFNPSQNTH
jgi:hypothetical protein